MTNQNEPKSLDDLLENPFELDPQPTQPYVPEVIEERPTTMLERLTDAEQKKEGD